MAAAVRSLGFRLSPAKVGLAKVAAGCVTAQVPKRYSSYHQIKSGLWVPEGYAPKQNFFHVMKKFFLKKWHALDESTRNTVVEMSTKTVLATVSGAVLMTLEPTIQKLIKVETNASKQNEDMVELVKAEAKKAEQAIEKSHQSSNEKTQKIAMDLFALKMVVDMWLFTLTQKSVDPSVFARINPMLYHHPVDILKLNKTLKALKTPDPTKFKVFILFDKNGAGYITREQLETLLRFLGKDFTESELNNMVKEDTDGNIDLIEFLKLAIKLQGTDSDKQVVRQGDSEKEVV